MRSNKSILEDVNLLLDYFNDKKIKEKMKIDKSHCSLKARDKFFNFFEKSPFLFNHICDDPYNFQMDKLKEMLNTKKKIEKKETTFEDASVKIGYQYYNEYVKPNISSDISSNK